MLSKRWIPVVLIIYVAGGTYFAYLQGNDMHRVFYRHAWWGAILFWLVLNAALYILRGTWDYLLRLYYIARGEY